MTPTEFLTKFYPFALQVQNKYGVPAQVILAQAALESGWGKSKLTTQANNFFGIKADSSWKGDSYLGSTEFENGVEVKKIQAFRKYPTAYGSFEDFATFLIKNKRYKKAFDYKNNPKAFASEVAKAGYATNPKYEGLIHNLIDKSAPVLSKISTEVISTVKNNPVKSGLGIFAALAALYFLTSGKK